MAVIHRDTVEFAPESDAPVQYMLRTREWYLALGYDNPYVWAHYLDVPFTELSKPLAESRLTLVTTAAPYQPGRGEQGPGSGYNAAAKFYEVYAARTDVDHDLRISHVAVDRAHMSADQAAYFPIEALRDAVTTGRVGAVAKRFYGAPTNRSQRHTLEVDCPRILDLAHEDDVDAVVLVPNCPVCHQTISLIARHLEANGIPTVVLGAAKDVVEHCGVPRFVFTDAPLGNACGRPNDPASQRETFELALRTIESAPAARTTVQNPLRWSSDATWKRDFLDTSALTAEDIRREREENDRIKQVAKQVREESLAVERSG